MKSYENASDFLKKHLRRGVAPNELSSLMSWTRALGGTAMTPEDISCVLFYFTPLHLLMASLSFRPIVRGHSREPWANVMPLRELSRIVFFCQLSRVQSLQPGTIDHSPRSPFSHARSARLMVWSALSERFAYHISCSLIIYVGCAVMKRSHRSRRLNAIVLLWSLIIKYKTCLRFALAVLELKE